MSIITVVFLIVLVIVILMLRNYKQWNNLLFKKLNEIEKRLSSLEDGKLRSKEYQPKSDTKTQTIQQPVPEPKVDFVREKIPEKAAIQKQSVEYAVPKSVIERKPTERQAKTTKEFWSKIEKQFVENWTGILGAVIMVVGVGFLGIYTALKLSAFYRFLMITTFSGVLLGGFFYLNPKEKWIKFALWLRSSAAALFLFACLGSGGIPGLQWITDPLYGLILLLIGISVNLYFSYAGGKQVFASLHVLLSLIALSIAPHSATTLIIGGGVALTGILLTYKEKWDYHLLLTVSLFFIYHLIWFYKINGDGLSFNLNLTGIITVLIVSISAAFVHYRKAYKTKKFEVLPFSVHLVNWLYFGIGLLLHSTESPWKTIFIVVGSIAAFFLARRARTIGIKWLYYTDTLIAQVTALIPIISLYKWGLDEYTIIGLLFVESLVFLLIMVKENEEYLYRIGTVALHLIGAGFILGGLKLMALL